MSSYFRISTNSNQLTRIPLRGTSLDADCAPEWAQLENTRLAQLAAQQQHDGWWTCLRRSLPVSATPQLARVLLAAQLPSTRIGHAASLVHTHATKNKPAQCLLGDSCVATSTSDIRSSLSMQAYQVDSLASLDITSWLGSPAAADSTDQPIVSASPYTSRGTTTTHGISDVSPVRESSTSPCPTIASAASDQGPQPLSTKRERDAQDVGSCESAEPRSPPKRACLPRCRSAPPSLPSQTDHADVWLQALAQDDGSRTTSPLFPSSGSAYLPSPYMPKTPHYSPIEPRWSPEA
ncbi:hypothetical protein BC831DRAFT_445507, partial [Entophlyctis helioformis]